MQTQRIVSGVGLLILVISLPMPWLSVNILGQYNLTLTDIYRAIFNAAQQLPSSGTLSTQTDQFNRLIPSVGAMMLSILLYPITIIVAVVSLRYRKASLIAGVLGVATGTLWIFGIDSLKGALISQMGSLGGTYGSLYQTYASLITSAITFGYGALIPIAGGIILLVAYFLKEANTLTPPVPDTLQPT